MLRTSARRLRIRPSKFFWLLAKLPPRRARPASITTRREVPMRVAAFVSVLLLLPLVTLASPDDGQLVVHEWGTFTSLQDEAGRSVGGVNIDDEPLPKFVHRLGQPRP